MLLLGLGLLTDGLRLGGGSVLKANLRAWAETRWRAFETGIAIALLVPSSAASTRAAVGFVNSGLVRLENALWLSVGISFGSVVTAFVVLAVGFADPAFVIGLALVGVGGCLRFGGVRNRRAALGMGVCGVGLCLLGLVALGRACAEMGALTLDHLPYGFATELLLFGSLAALLAAATRSASVVVAAAVVATASGTLGLPAAMAVVAGANLGPVAAALFEFARGTAGSKRVALMHIGFHSLTTALGVILLVTLLPAAGWLSSNLGAAVSLALYHLAFTGAGALLLIPAGHRLVYHVSLRFQREEMDHGRSPNLDPNLLAVPDLALDGFLEELGRLTESARGLAHLALKERVVSDQRLRQDAEMLERRVRELDQVAARLITGEVPADLAPILVELPRASEGVRYLLEEIARFRAYARQPIDGLDPRTRTRLRQLELAVLHLVEGADALTPGFRAENCSQETEAALRHLEDVRHRLHEACCRGEVNATTSDHMCARLDSLGRIAIFASESAIGLARVLAPMGQDEPFAEPAPGPMRRLLRRVA